VNAVDLEIQKTFLPKATHGLAPGVANDPTPYVSL